MQMLGICNERISTLKTVGVILQERNISTDSTKNATVQGKDADIENHEEY